MNKITAIALCFALIGDLPVAATPSDSMFPLEAIQTDTYYQDWYGPVLQRMGEKPLWSQNDADPRREIMRFLFVPGVSRTRGRGSTVIRIEIEDGEANLTVRYDVMRLGIRFIRTPVVKRMSRLQVVRLQELAAQSDTWKFPVSDWNLVNSDGSDLVYIHCTELVMERSRPADYAVSHVSVSCNAPRRLMPLVNYVAEISQQSPEVLQYSQVLR